MKALPLVAVLAVAVGFTAPVLAVPRRSASYAVARQETTPAPPTKPGCTAHGDHYDCSDGGFCELVEGAWECTDGEGNPQNADGTPREGDEHGDEHDDHAAEGSGEPCVVHGGHTHGDCANNCGGIDTGAYNQGLHIAAVFVILASSMIGIGLPIAASSLSHKTVFRETFFVLRHFGTGIIIATALIHLLYHAFVMFGNACIRGIAFEPVAPAIAIGGIYIVFFLDLVAMRYIKRKLANRAAASSSDTNSDVMKERAITTIDDHHSHGVDYAGAQAHFDVLLLEAGIIFHSIMIGVTLGATGGNGWIPLLIAVVFHQMFEGLSLGARIALLIFPDGKGWKKWVMGGAFGLITPIGIAIGIAVHNGYNPNSNEALLSIGILDSISAGILLYAGLVEMLAHDFLQGELREASNGRVAGAVASLVAGTLLMSLLGKWA